MAYQSIEFSHQLTAELSTLAAELNAYINYQRTRKLKEPGIEYDPASSNHLANHPTNPLTNQSTSQP